MANLPGCWIKGPFFYEADVVLAGVSVFSRVYVGRRSYMNDGVIRDDVRIGRYCSIGRRCTIGAPRHSVEWLTTHPFAFMQEFRVPGIRYDNPATEIGHDVWIGDNVVIVAGVKVGTGAVIGAGAVVTKDVAPYDIVGGVPAKVIRSRFDELIVNRLLSSEWWMRNEDDLKGLKFNDVQSCLSSLENLPAISRQMEFIEHGA